MRGELDKEVMAKIEGGVPEMLTVDKLGLPRSAALVSVAFKPDSSVPVALVCLNDVCTILNEARVALIEASASLVWFRERSLLKSKEVSAVWIARFYISDAAFRLYAAGEHLAPAVICMLEIDERELKEYAQDRNTSKQSKVGKLMLDRRAGHRISEAIRRLEQSPEWTKTITFRNEFVHEQPPTVEGLGIVYHIQTRWTKFKDCASEGNLLTFGGDKPKYSVDDLLGLVQAALRQFREAVIAVSDSYREILDRAGIRTLVDQTSPGGGCICEASV